MRCVYMDYNATTPIAPTVAGAMQPFLAEHFGLPTSLHPMGRATAEAIEDARTRVAKLLGAERSEIVFTSCGTESTNWALFGIMSAIAPDRSAHLIISDIEHAAVRAPAEQLEAMGYDLTVVSANEDGVVTPDAVREALRPNTILASVMHANHETGVIQPIREIGELCRANRVLFHTDASQSVGKISVRPRDECVDLLSLSGHKIHAPKGVGALFLRSGVAISPMLFGEGNEGGLRSGAENVAGIVGLGAAAELVLADLQEQGERLSPLRDKLGASLEKEISRECRILGREAERLPNTLCVAFPDVDASAMLRRIPELRAATGSSLRGGAMITEPALVTMGLSPEEVQGVIRLSLGRFTKEDDIEYAVGLLSSAWHGVHY